MVGGWLGCVCVCLGEVDVNWGIVYNSLKPACPWDNLCLQIRLKDTMCVVICFYLLEGHQAHNKFSGRFERERAEHCLWLLRKKRNRFSFNVTFIIFKQLIRLQETEKEGDPPLLFQWRRRGNGGGGQPSDGPNNVYKRKVMFFKKLPWPVGTHLTAGLNGRLAASQCALCCIFLFQMQ